MSEFPTTTAAIWRDALQRHLPPGRLWNRRGAGLLHRLHGAFGVLLNAAHNWMRQAHLESDPREAVLTLDEWERAYGLPDPCDPTPPASGADRRLALHAKVIATGGQSRAYFLEIIAALLGHSNSSIAEHFHFRCDVSVCGDALSSESEIFHWQVDDTGITHVDFTCDVSVCGDPLREYSDDGALLCTLNTLKPAHTTVTVES